MRSSVLVSLALVVVVVVLVPQPCEAQYDAIVAAIGAKVIGLWRNEETDFLGHSCNLTVKPKIRRFQLYYQGRMWCPGWTTIRGEGLTRSHSGVAGKTTQDFARKALQQGLITEEEARTWVNS